MPLTAVLAALSVVSAVCVSGVATHGLVCARWLLLKSLSACMDCSACMMAWCGSSVCVLGFVPGGLLVDVGVVVVLLQELTPLRCLTCGIGFQCHCCG